MKKKKSLYIISCSLVLLCTLIISTACIIFYSRENNEFDDTSNHSSSARISFNYDDEISIYYGDSIDLSPTETSTPLIYTSSNTEILTVSEGGLVTTKKCGEAVVKIRNGTELIKTVKISIELNYEINNLSNCVFSGHQILLNSPSASFALSAKNSKNEEVKENIKVEICTSEGLTCKMKMFSYFLNASKNGSLTIKFPEVNYEVSYQVVLNN